MGRGLAGKRHTKIEREIGHGAEEEKHHCRAHQKEGDPWKINRIFGNRSMRSEGIANDQ